MKKIFALLITVFIVFSLCACGSKDTDNKTTSVSATEPATGTSEIEILGIPDPDMLRPWKIAGGTDEDPVIVFTAESTVRIIKGTMYLESYVTYGKDGLGNKSIATSCSEFRGQSVYKIDGDVLTITLPVEDENGEITSFNEIVYNAVEYTPVTLEAKEGFTADESLVGVWTYGATGESYQFTEDGYAILSVENFNGNDENNITKGTYIVKDGELTVYIFEDDKNELSVTYDYSIDGTKLLLDDADYYLNGEGDPSVESAAE